MGLALARGCLPWGRGVWAPHQEGMRVCSWLQKMNSLNLEIQAEKIELTLSQTSVNKQTFLWKNANITLLTTHLVMQISPNNHWKQNDCHWHVCDHGLTLYLLVIWGAALPFWAQWVCPACGTLGYKWESWLTVCQWDCSFCHVFSFQFGCVVPWRDMTLTRLKWVQ